MSPWRGGPLALPRTSTRIGGKGRKKTFDSAPDNPIQSGAALELEHFGNDRVGEEGLDGPQCRLIFIFSRFSAEFAVVLFFYFFFLKEVVP